ncbi:MAG TPA: DegQ family serine endoprotease [Stellaceae bacterium]|nr:DegQ family serine endoprotease [Stellaceae bacterium]
MLPLFQRLPHNAAVAALGALLCLAPAGIAAARPAPASFADLAEKLLPSVVNISTTQRLEADRPDAGEAGPKSSNPSDSPFEEFFRNFFDHDAPQQGRPGAEPRSATSLGSGFIVDPAGYVVTNYHVIGDADEITVILHDDTNLKAKLVGRDPKTDIALLKVNTTEKLVPVVWGDSDAARVGDWVLAIGNPFGLGGTVTAGIVSARQRDINAGPYDDFLQTDAPINRGNSGGPMFNMDGEVIGINTAIYSPSGGSIGIGFAIPSSLARAVVEELKNEPDHTVHRGWLGVRIQEVTGEIAESLGLAKAEGALVASVMRDGPARLAGVRPGDVILTFNGKAVTDMRRLPRLVAETPVDRTVPLTVWRDHQQRRLRVKVGRLAENAPQLASARKTARPEGDSATATARTLGLTLSSLTPDLRHKFSLSDTAKGIVVVEVAPNSPAAAKGMRPGDVILEAAQEELKRPDQLTGKVADAKKSGRKSILLLVDRQGDLRFVPLRLDQG